MNVIPGNEYWNMRNKKLYKVLCFATHTETEEEEEEMVVYQQQYGDYGVWVRPLQLFKEKFKEL